MPGLETCSRLDLLPFFSISMTTWKAAKLFPRWLNTETSDALKVKPEKGKAILFYNLLPDGNYDERSQHAALPVTKGDKYLTNLWIWDPIMDHTTTEHY
jgi:hypothetical protein